MAKSVSKTQVRELEDYSSAAELALHAQWLAAKEAELRIEVKAYEFQHKQGLYCRIDAAQAEYERVATELVHSLESLPDRVRELCPDIPIAVYDCMRSELEHILESHRHAALNLEPAPTIESRDKAREKKAKQRAKKAKS